MAVLLYSIVIVQLVCHAPRTGLNIFEIYQVCYWTLLHKLPLSTQAMTGGSISLTYPWIVDLSHLFLAISSASNVIIFTIQVICYTHYCLLFFFTFLPNRTSGSGLFSWQT